MVALNTVGIEASRVSELIVNIATHNSEGDIWMSDARRTQPILVLDRFEV